MNDIITAGVSAAVTASESLIPANQVPFAITAAITLVALAGFAFSQSAADRKKRSK